MSKIQIKRYNGATTSWEDQFPVTKAQHIVATSDGTTAIFDGSDKLKLNYLPDAVFDSLLFTGVIATPGTASAVALAFEGGINSAISASRSAVGIYFVLSAAGTIAQATTSVQTTLGDNKYYQWTFKNDDAGSTSVTSSGALEIGDWVVVTKISGTGAVGTPYILELAVINNVYEVATTSTNGLVTLSSQTVWANLSGNNVITDARLKALVDVQNYASASHTHTLSAITDVTATASELNLLDGELITTTELNYLSGVTSGIQGQLNGKAATSHTHLVANITDLTATATELNFVDGVTSAIQTQLDAKAPTANPTFTGTVVLPSTTSIGTISNTELSYLDGVTSAIQTQLNGKQATITGGATTITSSNLTVSRALVSDGSGKVAVSAVTSTELGYLSGVTSGVQTQLNSLAGRVRVYYDGTPTGMVTNDIWFDAI